MASDATPYAEPVLMLLRRFVGNQPNALAEMREQIARELEFAEGNVTRLRQELAGVEELLALEVERPTIANGQESLLPPPAERTPFTPGIPPLRKAILTVLRERPGAWDREELFAELVRRGWAPGGKSPRNTLVSRLSELVRDGLIARVDDGFGLPEEKEVTA